jgi:hypothetical protein
MIPPSMKNVQEKSSVFLLTTSTKDSLLYMIVLKMASAISMIRSHLYKSEVVSESSSAKTVIAKVTASMIASKYKDLTIQRFYKAGETTGSAPSYSDITVAELFLFLKTSI